MVLAAIEENELAKGEWWKSRTNLSGKSWSEDLKSKIKSKLKELMEKSELLKEELV